MDLRVIIHGLHSTKTALTEFGLTPVARRTMAQVGNFALLRIKERTLAGKDVHGKPFVPYSEKYMRFRKSKGRPTDDVDLFFSGGMMAAMQQRPIERGVQLFFASAQEAAKAHGHNTGFNGRNPSKKREFFALSDKDVNEIRDIVEEGLRDV